jgi:ribosomal protein S18 acetylase RimI-like enzyme
VSEVEVRPARPDELDRAGAVTVAGYAADGHLVRPGGGYDDVYAARLADAATRARDSIVLVAAEDDTLLGAVTWCPPGSSWRELGDGDDHGELRMLAVAPSARGRGVGAALLDACLVAARTSGLAEVRLCSLPQMTTAHRLYASRGFARRPDLDWRPAPDVLLWGFGLDLAPR